MDLVQFKTIVSLQERNKINFVIFFTSVLFLILVISMVSANNLVKTYNGLNENSESTSTEENPLDIETVIIYDTLQFRQFITLYENHLIIDTNKIFQTTTIYDSIYTYGTVYDTIFEYDTIFRYVYLDTVYCDTIYLNRRLFNWQY